MEKVISIVGAGGKTTLVHKLAREYHRSGKGVLVTTTTHMYVEADTDLSCDFFALRDKIIKEILFLHKMKSQTCLYVVLIHI